MLLDNLPLEMRLRAKGGWDDFLYLYQTLYPEHKPEDIVNLIDTLHLAYLERRESLRALDRKREKQPDWYLEQDWVATMFYTDRWAGNLSGIPERIGYLQEAGINYIHLMPLLETREGKNDGGYAVQNFRQVNSALGSIESLKEVLDHLHASDMVVALDFVMNHTAKEHVWAQSVQAGETHFRDYYLLFPDRTLPDLYEKSLPEVFPDFAPGNFSFVPEINQWVWTTFNDFQWDLNYRNPDVFRAMLAEMLFLANLGADVLRLDAVPFLWKEMGTDCQNREEAVMLLVIYRYLTRLVAPGVLFKSEAIVSPEHIIRYLGAGGYPGKACEIGYNATLMNHLWHAAACGNTMLLSTTLSQLPPIPETSTWINYLRCHDDIGWGISDANAAAVNQDGYQTRCFCSAFYTGKWTDSFAQGYTFQTDPNTGESRISGSLAALIGIQKNLIEGNQMELEKAIHRYRLMHSVLFFLKGIPMVYAGDEIGMLNDFSYLKDSTKREDNRWLHRPPMDWQKAALRKEEGTIEYHLFRIIAKLSVVRKSLPALHGSASERILPLGIDCIFCAERTRGRETLLLLANFSSEVVAVRKSELPLNWQITCYVDNLSACEMEFEGPLIFLPPMQIFWLQPATKKSKPTQSFTLNFFLPSLPGESVYLMEINPYEDQEAGEKEKKVCRWENDAWTITLDLRQDSWLYFKLLRMFGQEVLEISKPQLFYAGDTHKFA